VATVRLKITLRGVRPPVWRRLVVPSSVTLAELHSVFQTAMGWTDSHLHSFDIGGVLYGDVDDFDGDRVGNETRTRLSSVARVVSKFRYEYDFGDGWEHDVLVEQVQADASVIAPYCLAGRRACPPEDCGGPWGMSICWRCWPIQPMRSTLTWPSGRVRSTRRGSIWMRRTTCCA
jgi:hypothetical protein